MAKTRRMRAETMLKNIQKGLSFGTVTGGNPGYSFQKPITLFKRRELVKPYLHPYDASMIYSKVRNDISKNFSTVAEMSKVLPIHLVQDIFSLFYNKQEALQFEPLDQTNKIKFKILEHVNNSLVKIVTNDSMLASYVYTEAVAKYLYQKFITLPEEERDQIAQQLKNTNQPARNPPQQPQQQQQQGQGQQSGQQQGKQGQQTGQQSANQPGQGGAQESSQNSAPSSTGGQGAGKTGSSSSATQQDIDALTKMMDKLVGTKSAQTQLENAFKEAQEKINDIEKMGIDLKDDSQQAQEEQKEVLQQIHQIKGLQEQLRQLSVSNAKLMNAVKAILDKTSSHFSPKCIETDVSLFDAEELLEISNLEFLHPALKMSKLLDISVTERKYVGKFDLYVDISGSMDSSCQGTLGSIKRMTLAMALATQMKRMNILKDLYKFDTRLFTTTGTQISILSMKPGGGTDIDLTLKKIKDTGVNSVILTDAEDQVNIYVPNALFIGVGSNFYSFERRGAGQQFINNSQCIIYNGKNFITKK